MQSIIVSEPGCFLGKTSERLVVRGPRPRIEAAEGDAQLSFPFPASARRPLTLVTSDGVRTPPRPLRLRKAEVQAAPRSKPDQLELPFFRISEIVIAAPGVSISTDLIAACCQRGIRVSFLDSTGRPFAMLSSPMLTATVATRREQMAAYGDGRGCELAKAIIRGKLTNQAALLKYFGKYKKSSDPDVFAKLTSAVRTLESLRAGVGDVSGERIDETRGSLLAIEGAAGRAYWEGVRALLDGREEFAAREHRGATDPVNSALNYGYGILYSQVWGAVMNAGLEPFAGFLHVDRPGKPSLVLDLVEEFRQPLVDRGVIALLTRGSGIVVEAGMLTKDARRLVAVTVVGQLESEIQFRRRKQRFKSIIQIQARNVASFLRGGPAYRPFAFKW